MAQWVRVLDPIPDNFSLILGTHGTRRKLIFTGCPLIYMHAPAHTHRINEYKKTMSHLHVNILPNCIYLTAFIAVIKH